MLRKKKAKIETGVPLLDRPLPAKINRARSYVVRIAPTPRLQPPHKPGLGSGRVNPRGRFVTLARANRSYLCCSCRDYNYDKVPANFRARARAEDA